MDTRVRLSFTPGEIIAPGTTLKVHCCKPIRPQSVEETVSFYRNQQRVHTVQSTEDNVIRIWTDNLKSGHYKLSVGQVCDHEGTIVAGPTQIPLVIGALKGRVSNDLRVEHTVHLATNELSFSRLLPGQDAPPGEHYVEFVKTVHRETGKMVIKAFSKSGEEIDGYAHLAEIENNRNTKFGCIDEALWKRLEHLTEDNAVDVVILPDFGELAIELASIERDFIKQPEEERRVLQKCEEKSGAVVRELRNLGISIKKAPSYFIYATMPPSRIHQIGRMKGIRSVLFDDQSAVMDLGNLTAISRADRVHALGVTGAGVNIAVFESGPRNPAADLPIRGRYLEDPPPISDDANEHGRLVCGIISNTEVLQPHGIAPGCNLFSANSLSNDALKWATTTRDCTVISQSFHRGDEQTSAEMSADDLLKDLFGLGATIVQAAGNGDASEYVNHKGYNTIVVGSHNDAATAISGFSVFRNPRSIDRELPHITANGEVVTAVGVSLSGTSFAAPAVAGTVALIQQSNSDLKNMSAACRAIILASADRNISGSTWWQDIQIPTDASDGAGALNAEAAVLIVQSRGIKDGPPRKRAWDGGRWFDGGSFGPDNISSFRYRIQVPPATTTGIFTVKVAFTWNSFIPGNASGPILGISFLHRRYDLLVLDDRGVQVANSSSFDNNYEIAEFTGLPSQEYAIALRLTHSDTTFSPTNFGIAWIVTEI